MRWLPLTRWGKIRSALLGMVLAALALWFWLLPLAAWAGYTPKEGDVVFQSLPGGVDLIEAIEGATHSPFSHCGMVEKYDGQWVVLEAIEPVKRTPLFLWIWRGRGSRFAAYRLKPELQAAVPAMLAGAEKFMGHPYDSRYRMDDEFIYCSELVFKGYRAATGKDLGKLMRLGDLDWKPYMDTIIKYDGCTPETPPLDRLIITPRDLALAPELARVYNWGY